MEWIDINEELPELDIDVLLYYTHDPEREDGITFKYMTVDSLQSILLTKYGKELTFNRSEGVTHWMHLPEPPKE